MKHNDDWLYAENSAFGKAESQHWKYDLGVRAEQVLNDGNTQNNSTKFTNSYLKLFPTASIVKVPILIGVIDKMNRGE